MPKMNNGVLIENAVVWELDPLGKHTKMHPEDLANSLGYIPSFIEPNAEDVEQNAIKLYNCGVMSPLRGGTTTKDGIFKFPGDPNQYPLARTEIQGKGLEIFVYPYGFIAFLYEDKVNIYRFD